MHLPTGREPRYVDHAFVHSGNSNTGLPTIKFAQLMQDHGAGEILLTSVDKDGTRAGYDLHLLSAVAKAVSVPVVANGGCQGFLDMSRAFAAGADAVAASSMFLFTPITPHNCSLYLNEHGIPARV